ncbi:MAG: transcriptional regulator, LacI-family [Pseudomonadota bacterium]|jgi:LacI family kdg operon repressor
MSARPESSAARSAKLTIQDVADAARVSKATVSRYLNRGDAQLSPEIAARVAAAIESLQYRPSPMAQALKRGRSSLIGLVVADVTNPYSVAVLQGVEKACRDAGYMVMLFNIGNDDIREREAVEALSHYQVEGFILHTLGRDTGALAHAHRMGKPVVLVDRRIGDAPVDLVGLDNASAVRLAARHLLDNGFRRLLYVTEASRGISSREERVEAFRAFLAEEGGGVRGAVLESAHDEPIELEQTLGRWLAEPQDGPVAVLSANAVMTLQVAAACNRRGWQFGRELGLVGFDDPPWLSLVGPGLSAIAQPTDDIGHLAVRCLLERLRGEQLPPRHILLPGALMARGSSRPLR